eukprot:2600972-Pyramimonas_sp.AAC.3
MANSYRIHGKLCRLAPMAQFDDILADALASYDHLLAAGVPPARSTRENLPYVFVSFIQSLDELMLTYEWL